MALELYMLLCLAGVLAGECSGQIRKAPRTLLLCHPQSHAKHASHAATAHNLHHPATCTTSLLSCAPNRRRSSSHPPARPCLWQTRQPSAARCAGLAATAPRGASRVTNQPARGGLCVETIKAHLGGQGQEHRTAKELHTQGLADFLLLVSTTQGPLAPNTRLKDAVRLFDGRIKGAGWCLCVCLLT